jgi:hypothetical protein
MLSPMTFTTDVCRSKDGAMKLKHNDTQHNDIQHNDTQNNEFWHNNKKCDTQHNDIQHNSSVIMLNVANNACTLSVIMLSVMVPSTDL